MIYWLPRIVENPFMFFFWLGAARAKISLFLDGGGLLICVEILSFFPASFVYEYGDSISLYIIQSFFSFLKRNFADLEVGTRHILAQ